MLNWPHTSVTVNLPHIKFSRKSVIKISRYLNYETDIKPDAEKKHHFVSYITPTSEGAMHTVYTYNYIAVYVEELLKHARETFLVIILKFSFQSYS